MNADWEEWPVSHFITMRCKVCGKESHYLFNARILNKYDVKYFKCAACFFIQTEDAFWLDDAYANSIAMPDVGLLSRNIRQSGIVSTVIRLLFNPDGVFMDYGGGYGLFVRLMRDKGFDFIRQDKYCRNIFAQHFDASDFNGTGKFELLTAFEVFEHLKEPVETLREMFGYSDSVLFSTEIQPARNIKSENDWWYFIPQTGQHISFYHMRSLFAMAKTCGVNLYSDRKSLHLLTKRKISFDIIRLISLSHSLKERVVSCIFKTRKGLTQKDFEAIKKSIG